MSRRSIQQIILLMTFCLIGIISFQAYWIWLNIKEKEQELNNTISEALYEVEERLLNNEADVFVKSTNVFLDSSLSQFELLNKQVIRVSEIERDQRTHRNISTQISTLSSGDGAMIVTQIPSKVEEIIQLDSTLDKLQLFVRYQEKKDAIEEIVEKISWEFAVEDVSLKDRIQRLNLDSILETTFSDYGLGGVTYNYSVKDQSTDSLILSSINQENSGLNGQYQRLILESVDNGKGGLLQIDFPSRTNYLLHSIWPLLLLSSLLTGALIYTFYFTLKSIYKQKKVAEIKSDFINNMTHEFKTPLATISLAIDAIMHKDVRSKESELMRYGEIIKKENKRMNTQIERVLDMALFDKKDITLKNEMVDIHKMLSELKDDMELKINAKEGKIQLELDADKFKIETDKMHIFNVLRNLIDNAIKYSTKEIDIQIKTQNVNGELLIGVSDRGLGMNNETLKKIFDRFYRKTEGNIHTTKGFGLGLAYVKEILYKMNARIEVESKEGQGSLFTILYPLS